MFASESQNSKSFSFQKKGVGSSQIPGTRISYQNAQLLTSTGVSSLDFHLGGGLPVGTVLLLEEDKFNAYSSVLLKYFIAEGVTNNHAILLATGDTDAEKLLSELPAVATIEPKVHIPEPDDQLKIAWRYKGQKAIPETFHSFGHTYDLSKTISSEQLHNVSVTKWNPLDHLNESKDDLWIPNSYLSLLVEIKEVIRRHQLKTSGKIGHSLLRIAVSSLGSPLWETSPSSSHHGTIILRFLYILRSILRSSYSVAFITLPAVLVEDLKLRGKIHQMSDFVVKLESFIGAEKNKNIMFKDFDGLFQVIKLPCLNTFLYQIPTPDLAFKLKRKQFLIERLRLPPDIQESSETSMACGGQSKFDF